MKKSIRQKYENADTVDLKEIKKTFEEDLGIIPTWGERWFIKKRLRLINRILKRR